MFTVRQVRMAALAAACSSVLMLAACSSTAPRFRAHPAETESARPRKTMPWRQQPSMPKRRRRTTGGWTLAKSPTAWHAPGPAKFPDDTPAGLSRDRVLLDIVSFLGVPYRYGGISKQGIDCSGFTGPDLLDCRQLHPPPFHP